MKTSLRSDDRGVILSCPACGTTNRVANLVAQSSLPVIVDFWADWCGPCQMMAPEFAKAAAQAAGQMILAKVNTEQLPQVSATLRIQGIPAFILFKNGREAARTAGFQPAAQLLRWAGSV